MSESEPVQSNPDSGSRPMPAVGSFVIWVVVMIAIKAGALTLVADTLQTWVNGEPWPNPAPINDVNPNDFMEQRFMEHQEALFRDHRLFPPQSSGSGLSVPPHEPEQQ